MPEFLKVAKTDKIAPDQARRLEVHGKRLALFNVDGNRYALADSWTHPGGSLSEGAIAGEEVTCPWHGAAFNIRTGEVLGPPAHQGAARYNVRVTGTDSEVAVQ